MQEVSVRKAFISVFIFAAAFVIGVVMSSPASAQTDVVIEHRGMCHDAAYFETNGYDFNNPAGNYSLFNDVFDAEDPKAMFHAKITNNSANNIEAYVTIPDDGVVGPLWSNSANKYPTNADNGAELEGGAHTFFQNRVIAPGATSYIGYFSGITNGPEDVIVHIIQDGTEYSQTPVTRDCTATVGIENWQVTFGADGLTLSFASDVAKVTQWARYLGLTDDLVEFIPMLMVQDENGVWQRVTSDNGGFSAYNNHLDAGYDLNGEFSRETHTAKLWEQYPSLETANICDSTTPVTSRIVWASEDQHSVVGGTFTRPILDVPFHEFIIYPTDWHDDCAAEGYETPLCQYDANLYEDDPACVPPPTPTPVPTPTPEPTPTPDPDQDTDEDGVPDKEEEDPSCVETKDCDEDNIEDLPDGDDLDPDQDDDGIKDGDEIEGCVLDPDPECDAEILAVTGISTNRLLLYAFALMGLASMFVYSGRVFQKES